MKKGEYMMFEYDTITKQRDNSKKKWIAPLLRDRKYDMDIQAKNRRNNELVSPYGADFGPS
ncbi:hypothetical protein [Francisella hispaniensis]|uniref:Uncharacterized protein n=1 Tax=Francisella hispaniensis FSC454 TaxID=1088883 RepID=A0AAC9NP95_9GAMM|nr:hypothetical protein [Francisella hispaniensis]APD50681.1 hypothetical protein FSC454_05935 [Francisella hispaniensis FSC454]KYW86669.1 hypothetical protein AUF42_02915 [Francisella hispaniensis FSC454]